MTVMNGAGTQIRGLQLLQGGLADASEVHIKKY